MVRLLLPLLLFSLVPLSSTRAGEADLRGQALTALKKAVHFFRTQVSVQGGYLWRYSEDLSRREGEGKASPTTAWVQPPGTPAVGVALLAAYEATRDPYYLQTAQETAQALVKGQLQSGGWDYRIEFDPAKRKKYLYRAAGDSNRKGFNVTTLDDDTTQAALRFLMRVDQALSFKDKAIHEAATFALQALLRAQYPNGAWAQRFDTFPEPKQFPVKKASYPDSWSRTWPAQDYRSYYTLNDNNLADLIDTLLEAERIYQEPRYRQAVEKAGGFLLLAQMPEPQPGWAQQYDADMHPAWARKFEPPAVTGGESFGVLRTLLKLYRVTGDRKYLEPVPRALAYFQRSRLVDGRLARFYELKTNRPLYFTKAYQLTHDDADLPTHYGFKVPDRTASVAQELEHLRKLSPAELKAPKKTARPRVTAELEAKVKKILAALDKDGRWVEDGQLRYHGADDPTRRIIACSTFSKNVGVLSAYLAASSQVPLP